MTRARDLPRGWPWIAASVILTYLPAALVTVACALHDGCSYVARLVDDNLAEFGDDRP